MFELLSNTEAFVLTSVSRCVKAFEEQCNFISFDDVVSSVCESVVVDESEKMVALGVGSVTVVFCDVSGNTLVLPALVAAVGND